MTFERKKIENLHNSPDKPASDQSIVALFFCLLFFKLNSKTSMSLHNKIILNQTEDKLFGGRDSTQIPTDM